MAYCDTCSNKVFELFLLYIQSFYLQCKALYFCIKATMQKAAERLQGLKSGNHSILFFIPVNFKQGMLVIDKDRCSNIYRVVPPCDDALAAFHS